jgi:mono/diheme cytochrome c family protein
MRRALLVFLLAQLVAACSPALPDPQSAGAQIYQVRCSPCHQLYAPGSMTAAMWEVQVGRMQEEMLRRAVNPLTEQERYLVLTYLKAHAADGVSAAGASPGGSP